MASEQSEQRLNWSLKDLYLYLGRAVMCLSLKDQQRVYQGMAHILMEWRDTPRSELRKVFKEYDIDFKETCIHCNEPMPHWNEYEYEGEPICDACKEEADAEAAEEVDTDTEEHTH
jgi:hypothetical protein